MYTEPRTLNDTIFTPTWSQARLQCNVHHPVSYRWEMHILHTMQLILLILLKMYMIHTKPLTG